MNTLDQIEETLREKGYRITNQRKAILKVFLCQRDNFLSAQQIYEAVLKIDPGVNFSTVYRNIEILEQGNIIHKIYTDEGHSSYKLNEEEKHHHHFICKHCGKTEVIDFCPLQEMEEKLKEKDFFPMEHNFEIFGYCKQCKIKR